MIIPPKDNNISRGTNFWPWQNFSPDEVACSHCGEIYYWPEFMDSLQALRVEIGRPIRLLSAHRCELHNAAIGGAPLSQHLRMALDVDLRGHDRFKLAKAAKLIGFSGFGYYQNFIHLDGGRSRYWFSGDKARQVWQS